MFNMILNYISLGYKEFEDAPFFFGGGVMDNGKKSLFVALNNF